MELENETIEMCIRDRLDVVLGQSINPGQKIGQINDLSDYKIEAMIDEHYIDRVRCV